MTQLTLSHYDLSYGSFSAGGVIILFMGLSEIFGIGSSPYIIMNMVFGLIALSLLLVSFLALAVGIVSSIKLWRHLPLSLLSIFSLSFVVALVVAFMWDLSPAYLAMSSLLYGFATTATCASWAGFRIHSLARRKLHDQPVEMCLLRRWNRGHLASAHHHRTA